MNPPAAPARSLGEFSRPSKPSPSGEGGLHHASMMPFDWFQRFIEQSVKQASVGVFAGGKARLQLIAARHQFIGLDNDSVLV